MQRRVLQATLVSVLLVVLLLGIPLGTAWLTLVQNNLSNSGRTLLQSVVTATDGRLNNGQRIDEPMLEQYVDQTADLNVHISVTYDGRTVQAGQPPGENPVVVSAAGSNRQVVTISIPQSDVRAHTGGAVVLIVLTALSAIAIAISVALWQAQRLSAPLTKLTRRAAELGSGRARTQWQESGIAEIDMVAVELTKSGIALTERLEAESALASDASHQLRTPLTALSMRLDEILATSSEEWVRDEARVSLEQVDRLTNVVNDLINKPRSSQRRTPGVVELRNVLTQQSEEWKHAFRQAGRELRIHVPKSAAVWASDGPLTQVVATLIENSLMHGGGTTSLKVRANSHSTVIEVADQGEGVDPTVGTRIFERSVQGPKSTGTGVGLALARTLVEDDGGRLELLQEQPAVFGVFLITAPGEGSDGDMVLGESTRTSRASANDADGFSQGRVMSRQERRAQQAQSQR